MTFEVVWKKVWPYLRDNPLMAAKTALALVCLLFGIYWFIIDTFLANQFWAGVSWLLTAIITAFVVLIISPTWWPAAVVTVLGAIVSPGAVALYNPAINPLWSATMSQYVVSHATAGFQGYTSDAEAAAAMERCIAAQHAKFSELARDWWISTWVVPQIAFIMRVVGAVPVAALVDCDPASNPSQ